MRVTSEFWVTAYIKKRNSAHLPTVLMKRGATEAGAIFIRVDRLDGTYDLFCPASQLAYSDEQIAQGERLFEQIMSEVSVFDVMDKLDAEAKFDSDFWVVETECKDGSHDLSLAKDN